MTDVVSESEETFEGNTGYVHEMVSVATGELEQKLRLLLGVLPDSGPVTITENDNGSNPWGCDTWEYDTQVVVSCHSRSLVWEDMGSLLRRLGHMAADGEPERYDYLYSGNDLIKAGPAEYLLHDGTVAELEAFDLDQDDRYHFARLRCHMAGRGTTSVHLSKIDRVSGVPGRKIAEPDWRVVGNATIVGDVPDEDVDLLVRTLPGVQMEVSVVGSEVKVEVGGFRYYLEPEDRERPANLLRWMALLRAAKLVKELGGEVSVSGDRLSAEATRGYRYMTWDGQRFSTFVGFGEQVPLQRFARAAKVPVAELREGLVRLESELPHYDMDGSVEK